MKNLNEELNRMLYLTQHKRGQVISEQKWEDTSVNGFKNGGMPDEVMPFDAKQNSKGRVNLLGLALARNVNFDGGLYKLNFTRVIGKNLPKKSPGKLPETKPPENEDVFPELKFIGDELPYPDNFISPQFDLYSGSENKINEYVTNISDLIKENGGLNDNNTIKIFELIKDKNGKTIFIKGTADSFKPNFNVPNEMKNKGANKIDHDYGGKKDPAEMNLYLAEQRAIKFGEILAEKFSKKTGIPKNIFLMYMDFSGYSYYGTGTKGVKSIEAKINYKIPAGKPIETPGKTTPGTEGKVVPAIQDNVKVDLTPYGGGVINGNTIIDEKEGYQYIVIPTKICHELMDKKIIIEYTPNSTFNGNQTPKFKINNDGLISLDGISFGKLVFADKIENYSSLENKNESFMYISDPGVYFNVMDLENGYSKIAKLRLGLSSNSFN